MTTRITRNSPLLSVGEAAQLLGVHENTIRRWTDAGHITAYVVSRRGDRRYKKSDLYSRLEAGATN